MTDDFNPKDKKRETYTNYSKRAGELLVSMCTPEACVTTAKWRVFILSTLFNRFGFCPMRIVNKQSHDQLSVTG